MQHRKHLWIELIVELIAFAGLAASIILLWRNNLQLLLAVLGTGALVLGLWHRRQDVAFLLVIGVFGTLAEALFVHFGV